MNTEDVEIALDDLFRASPKDFVGLRTALAKQLKAAGDKAAAARVTALPRPSVAAWAVNQLHYGHGRDLGRLLSLGERLRAQQNDGAGISSALLAERQQLVRTLTRAAEALVSGAGMTVSPGASRGIAQTLEALSATVEPPQAPGRLVRELEPPGFGALAIASTQPRAVREPARVETKRATLEPSNERTTGRASPTPAVEVSARSHSGSSATAPDTVVDPLAARRVEVERVVERARRQLANVEQQLELQQTRLDAAEQAAAAVARELSEATIRVDRARGELAMAEAALTTARAAQGATRLDLDEAHSKMAVLRSQRDKAALDHGAAEQLAALLERKADP